MGVSPPALPVAMGNLPFLSGDGPLRSPARFAVKAGKTPIHAKLLADPASENGEAAAQKLNRGKQRGLFASCREAIFDNGHPNSFLRKKGAPRPGENFLHQFEISFPIASLGGGGPVPISRAVGGENDFGSATGLNDPRGIYGRAWGGASPKAPPATRFGERAPPECPPWGKRSFPRDFPTAPRVGRGERRPEGRRAVWLFARGSLAAEWGQTGKPEWILSSLTPKWFPLKYISSGSGESLLLFGNSGGPRDMGINPLFQRCPMEDLKGSRETHLKCSTRCASYKRQALGLRLGRQQSLPTEKHQGIGSRRREAAPFVGTPFETPRHCRMLESTACMKADSSSPSFIRENAPDPICVALNPALFALIISPANTSEESKKTFSFLFFEEKNG